MQYCAPFCAPFQKGGAEQSLDLSSIGDGVAAPSEFTESLWGKGEQATDLGHLTHSTIKTAAASANQYVVCDCGSKLIVDKSHSGHP